jgi:hypothetical protein
MVLPAIIVVLVIVVLHARLAGHGNATELAQVRIAIVLRYYCTYYCYTINTYYYKTLCLWNALALGPLCCHET